MLTVGYEKFETLIKKNTKPTVLTDIDMFCSINLIFSIVLLLCFVERQLVHKTFIDIYNTLHNDVYSCWSNQYIDNTYIYLINGRLMNST